jgi:phospholipid transport system substrate-binding protein
MANDLSRRRLLTLIPAGFAAASLPHAAFALNVDQARSLVDALVGEINTVIASGASESAMIGKFEGIFTRYADVNYIAQSALGPSGRGLPKGEIAAYTKAFSGYLARKYGRRFREFIGGQIEVTDARPLKSFFEVVSVAKLRGQAPFEVRWHIFDKSGKDRFFNLIIEGVNMLAAERTEIGAILDRAGGDIGGLTKALASAG